MRRLRKQGVAIVMAAMMMASGMQGSTGIIAPATVMAATEEKVYDNNIDTKSATVDFSALDAEDWGDKKATVVFAYTNDTDRQVKSNFSVKARVGISADDYATLDKDGSYIKLQGVVKLTDAWTYTKGDTWPYLDKNAFTQGDDGSYYADVTIDFKDKDAAQLMEVDFEIVGVGFAGEVNFSQVSVANKAEETKKKEVLLYENKEAVNTKADFSTKTEEDWNNKVEFTYAYTNDEQRALTENFKLKTRVAINADAYKTLETDGNHIKLQGVVKVGDAWTYTNGDSWPWLDKNAFTQGEDGNYYADAEVSFNGKNTGNLMEVDFEIVGVGFAGDVTFDNVAVYNIEESKPELEEKDPSVLASFDDESTMSSWAGETGYQYFHGGDSNATPDISYDANEAAKDGRLKVSLNYSKNSKESWSEAKVKYTNADGVDVSNYNQVSVDLIYSGENPVGKMKFYTEGIINKDCTVDTTDAKDLGNGLHKVTVTMGFSPTETPLEDLTIGLIGVNSSFVGDVYLDNLVLSQKNEAEDFVKITSQAGEGTQADILKAATTIKVTDSGLDESAKALQAYLNGLKNSDQVLFGHQNDVSRSVNANASLGDVYDVTGSVSGVFGIDTLALAGSEAGGTDAASALKTSVEYSKKAAQNGAIVSLSAHMPNFTNSKIKKNDDGSYDFFNCDFSESKDLSNDSLKTILPGGENNEVYNAYLDIIADYANQLADANIPVMFRPFHENTGSWFWWGATNSEESYKSLYRYTRDYLESKGVHNMLYVYSPCGPISSEEDFMSRYPGDEYVDVLGFDYYADYNYNDKSDSSDSYFKGLDSTCKIVASVAKKHDKIAGISECGVRVTRADGSSDGLLVKGNPVAKEKSDYNWYQKVNDIAKDNDMPYYLVWANFSDTNFYVPYKYDNTYGQEMINEFIDYYNNESSIFGKGTNFYNNISKLAAVGTTGYNAEQGYITAPFDKDEILDEYTLQAQVKNASNVKFVVKNNDTGKSVTLKGEAQSDVAAQSADSTSPSLVSTRYTATLTKADMETLGKTDDATITVVADGKEISSVKNLSIGKKKAVAPANVVEDFDYYTGNNTLLDAAYTSNHSNGSSASWTLDENNKADGTYGGAFTYNLVGKNSYTGRIKSIKNGDLSNYNALQMWVKPDGKGQKLVVQIASGNEEFEVYLTEFVKGTKAQYVTIPFGRLVGKQGGTFDPKNITKFAIYCNSTFDSDTSLTSTIYFDAIRAVKLTDEQLASANDDGYIVTAEAIGEQTSNDGNQQGNGNDNGNGGNQQGNGNDNGNGGSQQGSGNGNGNGGSQQGNGKNNGTGTNIARNAVTTTKKATNKATKTSDTSNVFIWIMGCVAGAGLLTASRKKSKKDQTLK